MVSNSKTSYTPPEAVSSSTTNSHDETPIITISENDIRIVLDKEDKRPVPRFERNSYKLERDPCLSGSRKPTNLAFCPHCSKENVRTRTKTYPNSVTWGCAALGAVIFLPLGVIPLVADSMKKTDHYCQNCGQKLATIKPFEGVGTNERS
jgi:ssDNA-binding Zn-finger/Zn-ribbon topoisomerase 1